MKEPISSREWPTMHAVWRLGLVTAKKVHSYLLEKGYVLDRRKVHLFLRGLTEKGYLRARKVGKAWTFVAVVEPEEAFSVQWQELRRVVLDGDPELVKTLLEVAGKSG